MAVKPNEEGGPYIFISYSHKIKDKADEVIKTLQASGYRVWFDSGLTPGTPYNDIIAERIEACEVFCCLLSEEYYQSQYCRQEFVYAKEELKKPVIPVYVGELEAIKATLPSGTRMWLAGVHGIQLNRIEFFVKEIEKSGPVSKCRKSSGIDKYTTIFIEKQNDADGLEILPSTEGCPKQNSRINSMKDGIIKFGHYEQEHRNDPIEWIVLAKETDRFLLISRYGLDAKRYNTDWIDVTWENCTLRDWLNTEFMEMAFSDAEKRQIRKVTVVNNNNPRFGTSGGNDTQDHIFLLSIEEVEKYLADPASRECEATEYAKMSGALVSGENDRSWWWLRSPGNSTRSAASVRSDGTIFIYGGSAYFDIGCVRPALWMELEH